MVGDQDEGICDVRDGGPEDPLEGCTFSMDPFRAETDQVVNLVQTLLSRKKRS